MNSKTLLHKTQLVILITIITMIGEIYFGFITHSMALLADGFHMGTHACALFITVIVCYFALKFKDKEEKIQCTGRIYKRNIAGIYITRDNLGIRRKIFQTTGNIFF